MRKYIIKSKLYLSRVGNQREINWQQKKIIKAKLCARGFEEEQNFRTDSPTCFREAFT